jgi:hypothetical protein
MYLHAIEKVINIKKEMYVFSAGYLNRKRNETTTATGLNLSRPFPSTTSDPDIHVDPIEPSLQSHTTKRIDQIPQPTKQQAA